ncbi:MAG: HNH endonuclease [Opitutaceae bacterium]|jgi:putative restriction endonuclease|nr:HNH endonuclease [Opitutaceae bacterium]
MKHPTSTVDLWLGKLTRLRAANGKATNGVSGPAPHKPLLLLSILDLAESGKLPGRTIARTPELVLRFRELGTLVADRWPTRLDLRLPFYHLKTQGFWQAFTAEMRPAQAADSCMVIELDPIFFELLEDRDFRVRARLVLVSHYFTEVEQAALFEFLGMVVGGTSGEANHVLTKALADGKRKGRSARFQVRVVDDYFHTCALTGYRCFTTDGASIVDAAHIEPWAATGNDDLTNGLALSKSAHWMFDAGLWTVDDDLRVVVNPTRFTEAGPEALQLRAAAGRHLQFAPQARLRPAVDSLRRHRLRFG